MQESISIFDLARLAGQEFEPSTWFEITQDRVNQFADATNDHQFIHVDPKMAAQTPFGGPIAHGFLTLSLLSHLAAEKFPKIRDLVMGINYGSDRVRFLQPVPVGSEIRVRQRLVEVTEKTPGSWLTKTLMTVDIKDQLKPAMVAEVLSVLIIAQADKEAE